MDNTNPGLSEPWQCSSAELSGPSAGSEQENKEFYCPQSRTALGVPSTTLTWAWLLRSSDRTPAVTRIMGCEGALLTIGWCKMSVAESRLSCGGGFRCSGDYIGVCGYKQRDSPVNKNTGHSESGCRLWLLLGFLLTVPSVWGRVYITYLPPQVGSPACTTSLLAETPGGLRKWLLFVVISSDLPPLLSGSASYCSRPCFQCPFGFVLSVGSLVAFTLPLSAVYHGLGSSTGSLHHRLPASCLCYASGGEEPLSQGAGLGFVGTCNLLPVPSEHNDGFRTGLAFYSEASVGALGLADDVLLAACNLVEGFTRGRSDPWWLEEEPGSG